MTPHENSPAHDENPDEPSTRISALAISTTARTVAACDESVWTVTPGATRRSAVVSFASQLVSRRDARAARALEARDRQSRAVAFQRHTASGRTQRWPSHQHGALEPLRRIPSLRVEVHTHRRRGERGANDGADSLEHFDDRGAINPTVARLAIPETWRPRTSCERWRRACQVASSMVERGGARVTTGSRKGRMRTDQATSRPLGAHE